MNGTDKKDSAQEDEQEYVFILREGEEIVGYRIFIGMEEALHQMQVGVLRLNKSPSGGR